MKIKDLELGQTYTIPLVVLSATTRETKAKKQYLALEFYDGHTNINGNFWDWGGKNIPDKNTILDVTAQVTEWLGVKQLNIKGMTTNTELHISEFTPNSGQDIGDIYKQSYAMISELQDTFLRSLGLGILEELQHLWTTAPGAVNIHHNYAAGTLIHSLAVARIAKAIAAEVPGADISLVTVGGMLHDLGKLFGYQINGIVCELTDEGKLFDHLFIGAEFVGNYAEENSLYQSAQDEAKMEILRHIILSHHGKQEYGAVVPPACLEAHIVYHADTIDAAAEQLREASTKAGNVKFTERLYVLENRPHLTINYVQAVMKKTE
jgi:3'-5' exoribonuclease